jgi:outer membrane protein TolC
MVRFRAVLEAIVVAAVVSSSSVHGTLWAQATRPRAERTRDRGLPEALPGRGSDETKRDIPLPVPVSPPTILKPEVSPIDLNTALRLAGVQNPEFNAARQRVLEAAALRQLAAARFLPSINPGMNYDAHAGNLQQSNGNILSVNRSAVYVGAGSNAVAAGTVNIPGVFLGGNTAIGIFAFLESRQFVRQRQAESIAVRNQVFLQVSLAYSELLRAEARHAVALQALDEARVIARLTADYAQVGQGRVADANRAATERQRREAFIKFVESEMIAASARLCQLLNLDPSIRLHPTDAFVVPHPLIPDPIPIAELIALGLLQRPELAAQRAAIARALLTLEGARALPFAPSIFIGYSAGGFGGGSNLVRPLFGGFGGRQDFDAVGFWTIQNLGVGNVALIRAANANLGIRRFEQLEVLNRVRAEIAEAYARTHARYAQIETNESAIHSGLNSFSEDLERIRFRGERDVLPIELLDSFRLLNGARLDYVDAIIDYDRAQFELYVALGQPPADMLAHPVPTTGVSPSGVRSDSPRPGASPNRAPDAGLSASIKPPSPPVPSEPAEPVRPASFVARAGGTLPRSTPRNPDAH